MLAVTAVLAAFLPAPCVLCLLSGSAQMWAHIGPHHTHAHPAGAVLIDGVHLTGNRLGRDWDANRGGLGPALGHWNVGGRWEDLWGCQSPLR